MANPIASVDGVAVRCPSVYQWELYDISDADAGRTEDTTMDKKRIGQCVKLQLRWDSVPTDAVSAILTAFNPEYISVRYLDAMRGEYRTAIFYVGDRTAPLYNAALDLWENVAFNIIERSGIDI